MNRRACLFLSMLVYVTLTLTWMACRGPSDTEFPSVAPRTDPVLPTLPSISTTLMSGQTHEPTRLRAAIPISQKTADAVVDLIRLPVSSASAHLTPSPSTSQSTAVTSTTALARWPDTEKSAIEYLQIEPISWYQGATEEQLKSWQASARMPDLVYLRHIPTGLVQEDWLDLNAVLAQWPEALNKADPDAFAAVRLEGRQFGIPFRLSAPVVFYRRDLLRQAQCNLPPENWTLMSWRDWLIAGQLNLDRLSNPTTATTTESSTLEPASQPHISEESVNTSADSTNTAVTATSFSTTSTELTTTENIWRDVRIWRGAAEYLPWVLPQARLDKTSNQLWAGVPEPQALSDSAALAVLRALTREVAAASVLTDPAQSQVISWLGDSAELSLWRKRIGPDVMMLPLPALEIEASAQSAGSVVQSVTWTVSALAIAHGRNSDAAAKFALFLATDPAALDLQLRAESPTGLIPAWPRAWPEAERFARLVDANLYERRLRSGPVCWTANLALPGWNTIREQMQGPLGNQLLSDLPSAQRAADQFASELRQFLRR